MDSVTLRQQAHVIWHLVDKHPEGRNASSPKARVLKETKEEPGLPMWIRRNAGSAVPGTARRAARNLAGMEGSTFATSSRQTAKHARDDLASQVTTRFSAHWQGARDSTLSKIARREGPRM